MGTTFTHVFVRTTDPDAVRVTLASLTTPARVADTANGWVAVYPEQPDFDHTLATRLSEQLNRPVFSLWEYDSEVGGYALFEGGARRDEFQTDPDYGAGEPGEDGEPTPLKSPQERARLAGNPDLLLPYCVPGTTVEESRAALGKSHADGIAALADHLGQDAAAMQERMRREMAASLGKFATVFAGTDVGDSLKAFSFDDYLAKPDPDTILPALAALLGIEEHLYGPEPG